MFLRSSDSVGGFNPLKDVPKTMVYRLAASCAPTPRRVAAGDIEALASMVTLAHDVETAIQAAVIGLRAFGYSWTEIATRLGISRQAARQRWNAASDPNS